MKKTIKRVMCALLVIGILLTSSMTAFAVTAGDVNSDSKLNSTDALCILKHSVGATPSKFDKSAADINADGKINSTDALVVLKITVGIGSGEMSKADVVKLYNDSIKAPYTQNKCVMQSASGVDVTVNKLLMDGEENPELVEMFENILERTEISEEKYTFYKGTTLRGEKAEDIIPLTEIELSKVQTATAAKYGDGYKLTIVFKPGTEIIKSEDISGSEMLAFEDMTLTYLSAETVAVTDAKGRIISVEENILGNMKVASKPDAEGGSIYMDVDMNINKNLQFKY